MGIGQRIGYGALMTFCRAVGMLPRWFLYHCLLDALYFFVYKAARYRVKVVRGNLALVFPEKNTSELRRIERLFYRHLSEVMVDTIDFTGITKKQILKRLEIEGLAEHEASVDGANWIAAMAHYGSWEYFAAYPLYTRSRVASAYHPIHNKMIDRLMLESRRRFGAHLVKMQNIGRFVAENKDKKGGDNFALGMIMDQSPLNQSSHVWIRFLGQPSRFFSSMEKFAVKYHMKVYFLHMDKIARARYRARFEMIYDGMEKVGEGEIVARYAARLEEQIRRRPELWMWSHRRWKRPAPPEVKEMLDAGHKIVPSTAKKNN